MFLSIDRNTKSKQPILYMISSIFLVFETFCKFFLFLSQNFSADEHLPGTGRSRERTPGFCAEIEKPYFAATHASSCL